MGNRKYPPLTPSEVVAIVHALGFVFKKQTGSHAHYEKAASVNSERAVVTIDMAEADFGPVIMKSMIEQSACTREVFYRATRKTAKKI
jgi:predicted RNA binding protein YcfA (HicA-like mRNA interferase family)